MQFAGLHAQPDSARTFVGELRHTLDGLAQLFAIQSHRVRLVLRQHPFEIGKVAGQLPAEQQTLAKLEEQVILVAGKLQLCIRRPIPDPASESLPSPCAAAAPGRSRSHRATPPAFPPSPGDVRRSPPWPARCSSACSSAPFSVKRDSSIEIAKIVFAIIDASAPTGISAITSGISGSSGKLSRDIPAMRVRDRPHTRLAHWFSCSFTSRSASGSSRT